MTEAEYSYGGARALVELHERSLTEFVGIWRAADERQLAMPQTSDPTYASREALLAHVLGWAVRYLEWICAQLGLPEPDVDREPDPAATAAAPEEQAEAVLAAWRAPLHSMTEQQACRHSYEAPWGQPYSIDAMLEHAVMHPMRHAHQLRRLLAEGKSGEASRAAADPAVD